MNAHQPLTNRARVARRRAALHEQGMRPRQFWLPDVTNPAVAAEIARHVDRINALKQRRSRVCDGHPILAA